MTLEWKPQNKPGIKAFKEFKLHDGIIIGVFQGSRGQHPDLDILIKYKEPKKRIRTPAHIHWVVDLLRKKEHNKELTLQFVGYLRQMWNNIHPFSTKQEQQNCVLTETTKEKIGPFLELNNYGEYSIEFMGHVIELMMIMEKTGLETAHIFRDVLDAFLQEKDTFSIVAKANLRKRN